MDSDCVMSDVQHEPAALDEMINDTETAPSSLINTLSLSQDEQTTLSNLMKTYSDQQLWKYRADMAANDHSKWRNLISTVLWILTGLLSAIAPKQAEPFMASPNFLAVGAFADNLNVNHLKLWREAVQKGVDNNDWIDLCRLFLRPKCPQPSEMKRSEQPLSNIMTTFNQKYRGMAVHGFLEYLKDNEAKYRQGEYYGKFCSIVQSSGTGKSRLLCEIRKMDVIVLYMNLRDPGDEHAFPSRDIFPAKILTRNFTDERTYTHKCHAFFAAIFKCLEERLSAGSTEDFINEWNASMTELVNPICITMRDRFFDGVEKEYDSIYAQIGDGTRDDGTKAMGRAFCSLQDMLTERKKPHGPFLVIAVDEAHELTPTQQPGNWRPSIVFCKAIADYSAVLKMARCWVVFASTTSKVEFASRQAKYISARVATTGHLLFPPYTELGWDQMATSSNEIPADKNAKLKYIRGFGRPLWTSVGDDVTNLESLARLKLAPGSVEDRGNQLAVLAQRFCLDIYFDHKEATSLIENAVASHGRICLTTTEDRTWSFTMYPSEPLLSCVAAKFLHKSPEIRKRILMTLNEKVKARLIEIRKPGELANRLIFLLGKDLYIRQSSQDFSVPLLTPNVSLESELFDCKMVPLIGYLEYLFGTSFWGETETDAKALFADAYINFSHWVPMKDNIGKREGISGQEWIVRLWQRTSAVQCCHRQPMVDAVIPIYFNHQGFSLCVMSFKLTVDSNNNDLDGIQLEHHSIDYSSDLPQIAILVDYGLDTSKVTAKITPGLKSLCGPNKPPCLRIYAAALTSDTFKFLDNQDLHILQELVKFEGPPELRGKIGARIRKHMEFGSTANANSMVWEMDAIRETERK